MNELGGIGIFGSLWNGDESFLPQPAQGGS